MEIKVVLEVSKTLEEAIKVFLDRLLSFEPEEFGSTGCKSGSSSVSPSSNGPVTVTTAAEHSAAVTIPPAKAEAPAAPAVPSMEEIKARILAMPGGKGLASKVIKEMGLQKVTDLKTDELVLDFVARLGVA
jgi:hypothetical protein